MKLIPPTHDAPAGAQAAADERPGSHPAGEDWLDALLQKQAGLDAVADQGFSAALMQMLPPQPDAARRLTLAAPGRAAASVLPAWLAAALPWLGLYGLVVSAAIMLWLALMQVALPGAGWPLWSDIGLAESRHALVNSLAACLAPVVILGWFAWWLREQDQLLE